MFGGLEFKGGTSQNDKKEEKQEDTQPMSAFSFLSSPATMAPAPAAAATSAFSFLSSTGADNDIMGGNAASQDPLNAANSGFSFLQAPVPSNDDQDLEPSVDKVNILTSMAPMSSSAFGFLSAPEDSPKPPMTASTTASTAPSAFSFLGSIPATTPTVTTTTSSFSMTPAMNEPPTTSPSTDTNTSIYMSSSVPAGSGIVFGGAATTNAKKPIKKRNRTVGIGSARTMTELPPPASEAAASMPASTIETTSASSSYPPKPPLDTKAAAREAIQRAEEFMQKMQTSRSVEPPTSTTYTSTGYSTTTRAIPDTSMPHIRTSLDHTDHSAEADVGNRDHENQEDDEFAMAKKAAEEAQAQLTRQQQQQHSLSGRMAGLFHRKLRPTNSFGSLSNNDSHHSTENPMETAVERLQREQEDIKRAMAERHWAMQQQRQQQPSPPDQDDNDSLSHDSAENNNIHRTAPSPSWSRPPKATTEAVPPKRESPVTSSWTRPRLVEKPDPYCKTPSEKLQDILADFQEHVERAMSRVLQLRQQRNMLLEERFVSLAKERLACQQIAQAEAQQTAAAEVEDFELADRLAAVIDGHCQDKFELTAILESIGRALAQLESQKQEVVGGVAKCFHDAKFQLENFQREQETEGRKDDTESMKRFSATARQLSTENERLQNELKHLERDEGLVAEERKELELSISEQTADMEKNRDQAKAKLDVIDEEIEELRRQLKEKETAAASLRTELVTYNTGISKVRVKFSRQLTRIEKKEASVRENRNEWENEKVAYESLKTAHEAEVKEYSESLLSHNEIMTTVTKEITLAGTFETIVAKEVVFESTGDQGEVADGELAHLQADVVKCEAAVSEGKLVLKAAEAVITDLEAEYKFLVERIPVLEEEKKAAVARRDFKAAGKASKEIKDATSRFTECQEELTGEAADRKKAALAELKTREGELAAKQAIAHEKEKEAGLEAMAKLGEKIKRLLATKKGICGLEEAGTIQGVGAFVLTGQINALLEEGQSYGAKFGGWDEIMSKIEEEGSSTVPESHDDEKTTGDTTEAAMKKEDTQDLVTDTDEPVAAETSEAIEEQTKRPSDEVDPDRIAKFKEVTVRFKEAEEALEAAVEREEYDEAENLDAVFQEIKTELEALDLTDAELAIAMEEDEPEIPVEDACDINENNENVDEVEEASVPKGTLTGENEDSVVEVTEAVGGDSLDSIERVEGSENGGELNDEAGISVDGNGNDLQSE